MFGCCGCETIKFKNKDGDIDANRLDQLCERIDSSVPEKERAERIKAIVKKCDCPCHIDGQTVLC